jgi:hypothetical protein
MEGSWRGASETSVDVTDSSVEQGLVADRRDTCGDTRIVRGRRAAVVLELGPWGILQGRQSRHRVCGEMADAAHRHTAPGGNGREAASAGGPSEPSPTLIRRSRRVYLSFAAGSTTSVRGGGGGADQTAWRQRPQRCGAAADEDQTFEGSALRRSGSTPSPSGTESPCHPPRTPRCPSPGARETQRTPCPVPGRNKPGPRGAEKTVEVVRNHEDGTGFAVARQPRPEGPLPVVTTRSWCRGVCPEWTAAGEPEEGTSKDRVRGRQGHATSVGPRSRGSRAAGGPAPCRARRTRSEGGEADAGSETRRHASVGTPWSRTGNGKRQEGSGEGPRAAAGR